MVNVYVISPKVTDITSFFRGVGPYTRLSRDNPKDINVTIHETMDTVSLFNSDVVVFQRPFNVNHHNWIQTAKDLNKPIIVDYDDDVLSVPQTNPYQHHYNNEQNQFIIKSAIQNADFVTVSTPDLAEKYKQINPLVRVIPNAWDFKLSPFKPIDWKKRNKVLAWRGGESHNHDLLSVHKQYSELSNELPDWTFAFFGGDTQFMNYVYKTTMNQNNFYHFQNVSMLQYMKQLKDAKPSIMVVPLQDTSFNKAKSNIAWIEGSLAGSVVIAPNWPEWQKPGIINYSDTEDFKKAVKHVIKDGVALWQQKNMESLNYIMNNLDLTKVNKLRLDIITGLVNGKK